MAAHQHAAIATSVSPNATSPAGGFWGNANIGAYSSNPPNAAMAPQAGGAAGGSQPHPNLSPYLALNFVIALVGIFPSRN